MNKILALTGVSDPEMVEIIRYLNACGVEHRPAMFQGKPVRPDNAYRADLVDVPEHTDVWLIECQPKIRNSLVNTETMDHHRKGDPGFGRPAAEYMEASTLGQVLAALARVGVLTAAVARSLSWYQAAWQKTPKPINGHWYCNCLAIGETWFQSPSTVRFIAAADHCLAAAYRGKCPDVDPDELMAWRAESRANFQQRTVDAVLKDVYEATTRLHHASRVSLAPGFEVADMRGTIVPELPEAAARIGVSYVAGPLVGPDGRSKFTFSGSAQEVEFFVTWAAEQGLIDVYAMPERGIAGAYAVRRQEA